MKSYLFHAVTLEEIIDKSGKIGLLKMDIEGGEFEVFKHLKRRRLGLRKMYEHRGSYKAGDLNQIISILSSRNFEVKFFYPLIANDSSESSYQIRIKDLFSVKA